MTVALLLALTYLIFVIVHGMDYSSPKSLLYLACRSYCSLLSCLADISFLSFSSVSFIAWSWSHKNQSQNLFLILIFFFFGYPIQSHDITYHFYVHNYLTFNPQSECSFFNFRCIFPTICLTSVWISNGISDLTFSNWTSAINCHICFSHIIPSYQSMVTMLGKYN